jgi:hypothetical protein
MNRLTTGSKRTLLTRTNRRRLIRQRIPTLVQSHVVGAFAPRGLVLAAGRGLAAEGWRCAAAGPAFGEGCGEGEGGGGKEDG